VHLPNTLTVNPSAAIAIDACPLALSITMLKERPFSDPCRKMLS
jgi:hypothetical protein